MNTHESFVGIDVSKDWLDIAWLFGQTLGVEHSGAAIAGLIERLLEQPPTLIVLEATGGLETALASALVARGRRPNHPGF
jgi:transposase